MMKKNLLYYRRHLFLDGVVLMIQILNYLFPGSKYKNENFNLVNSRFTIKPLAKIIYLHILLPKEESLFF